MRRALGSMINGGFVSKLAVAAMLAASCALPQSATAQLAEEGGLSPRLRKRTQRSWDPSAYDVRGEPRPMVQYPSAPQKPSRPMLAPGIGLGVSVASFVGGLVMVGVGVSQSFCISFGEPCETPRSSPVLIGTGAVLTVGGLIGTIVSGIVIRDRRHAVRSHHRRREDREPILERELERRSPALTQPILSSQNPYLSWLLCAEVRPQRLIRPGQRLIQLECRFVSLWVPPVLFRAVAFAEALVRALDLGPSGARAELEIREVLLHAA